MTLRNKLLLLMTAASAAAVLSCEKSQPDPDSPLRSDSPWQFVLTRSGETGHTDAAATFRASLLHNGTGTLMSDGTYCGYYTDNNWPGGWPSSYPAGWLYPCRTDDSGHALTESGAVVSPDAADWFDRIHKDSQYALRGIGDLNSRFGINYSINYALVFTSPAVRMAPFTPSGAEAPTGEAARNPMNYSWGFPITRTSEWAVSPSIDALSLTASYVNGQYVFPVEPILSDPHSRLTVKVACGALGEANIASVHFKDVISSAYYMPKTGTYEKWVLDGDDGTVPDYDPLASYYTENSYPTGSATHTGAGDKFVAPSGMPVHLDRKPGQGTDFIRDGDWADFDQEADEWEKGRAAGNYLLTAIRDFPVLSMDYGVTVGDTYVYEDRMPKIVFMTGAAGDIRTTVRLAQNLEPMKAYTLYIWVSSVYVHMVLTVAPWTTHTQWGGSQEGQQTLEVALGSWTGVNGSSLTLAPWTVNGLAEGHIGE